MRIWSVSAGGRCRPARPISRHPASVPDDRRCSQHGVAQRMSDAGYKQFVKTGADLGSSWPLQRPPYVLETNLPGVFAVGDVRAGSVKRVASAVGEGSMAVQFVHRVLAE